MVKVCNFSFFNEQRILSPKTGEPLAIACSDKHLFVAEEGCILEVYLLTSNEPIAQLRTVSPVVQILYNPRGDCIVTLERKNPTARMFARVYFKWRESTIDRPMRVSLISSLTQGFPSGMSPVSAEINELPADETMSVNCAAVCKASGRIAVGMDHTIRLFTLTPLYESGHVTSHSIEILLDVDTGVTVRKVDVFNDYLAFISACEVRVLKLSLLSEGISPVVGGGVVESEESTTTAGWESDQATSIRLRTPKVQLIDRAKESLLQTDEHFVSWSPSKVWEDERKSASSSLSTSLNLSHDSEPHPLYDRLRPLQASQHIETLALPAITMSTQERTAERHPVEVLGPVEYVWGQPVRVVLDEATPTARCRLLTMLYRRFSLSQIEGENRRGVTQSLPPRGSGRGQEEWGLHTVELVPVILEDSQNVVGVSCFVGGRLHGYLYDVASKARLVSSFSFTSETSCVASDGMFFYALSQGTVETFSNRAMQVALSNRPPTEGDHCKWLKQPCPSPNMDLTLMSSNKLIGGCCLATSRDYLVVLTKSGETTPTNTGIRFLQSLRKPMTELTWNIYILLKKDPLPLYQQFVEYADAIRETSLPMYQHVISEGHVLLRNQLLQNNSLTTTPRRDIEKVLAQNCFSLADSLCSDTRGPKVVTSIAAKYLILSGVGVDNVVEHITSQSSQKKDLSYQILLKYLSLVLGGANEVEGQLESTAHTVLDLYSRHRPKQLAHVLLTSPLGCLAPGHGLLLLTQYLQDLQSSPELFKGRLCHVILLLQLERRDEARDVLKQVPEDFLVDWLGKNMSVVMETNPLQLTALGKLLQSHWEGSLLELLTNSINSGQLTFEPLIFLVKVPEESLADNTLLKALLERVVLSRSHDNWILPAALQLVELLLARLMCTQMPRPPSATPFSLYGNRHKWLDSLPPFDGSQSSQPPTQTVLQDLMQLQALLCSTEQLPVEELAKHTLSQLSGCGQEVIGQLSLQLLTWPYVNKLKEAIVLVLEVCPVVTVELCVVYLPSELDSWRDLLSLLLKQLLNSPRSHTHQTLYKAALEHVVAMTTPDEFLSLLPPAGALSFFLPFIESSLHQYVARQLGERLTQRPARQ